MTNPPALEWPAEIYLLQVTDPVQGGPDGVANVAAKQLDTRTQMLREGQQAQGDQITNLETNLTNLTQVVAASQAEAVAGVLRAQLAGQAVYVEAFARGWSLIDAQGRGGPLAPLPLTASVVPVAGDDSLDVSSTAGLIVGDPYVLFNSVGYRQEVRVTEILTANRVRISPALTAAVAFPAFLGRTDWDVSQANRATASAGAVYLSPALDLGQGGARALVVRHAPGAEILLEWRNAEALAWVDADWYRRRSVDAATVETQYLLPAEGRTHLRLVAATQGTVFGLTTQNAAALPEGIYNARPRPRIAAPASGASDVSPLTALVLADYPIPPAVAAAQAVWELWAPAGTEPAWTSGPLAVTAAPTLPAPPLVESAAYRLRVQVTLDGVATDWSRWVDFVASDNFKRPLAPTITSPGGAAPADLGQAITLSAFSSPDQADVQTGTQVMLRPLASASWADPLWDSGSLPPSSPPTLPTNLAYGAAYLLRARQRGLVGGWSPWSADAAIRVRVPEWWITQVGDSLWVVPRTGLYQIVAIGGGASGSGLGSGGGSGFIVHATVALVEGLLLPIRVGRGGNRALMPLPPDADTAWTKDVCLGGEPTIVGSLLLALGGRGVPTGTAWPGYTTEFALSRRGGVGGSYGGDTSAAPNPHRDGWSDGGAPAGLESSGSGIISRLNLIPGAAGRGSNGEFDTGGGAGGIVPDSNKNLQLAQSGAGWGEGGGRGYGAGGGGGMNSGGVWYFPSGAPGLVVIRYVGDQ